jgi:hypothetical protein
MLNGPVGNTYAFYSVARDLAANIEEAKTVAEATVTIVAADGSLSGGGFIEAGREKWHFTLNAGQGQPALQIWANGPSKRFVATSIDAVLADPVRLSGSGTWNGQAGYTFEASAADRGEPGRKDLFSFVIKNPQGGVIARASGTLSGGNIQSKR